MPTEEGLLTDEECEQVKARIKRLRQTAVELVVQIAALREVNPMQAELHEKRLNNVADILARKLIHLEFGVPLERIRVLPEKEEKAAG